MNNYNFTEEKKFEMMCHMTSQNIEIPEHRYKYIKECEYYYNEVNGKFDRDVLNKILEKFSQGNKKTIEKKTN
jgi:hypothetical protein